MNEIQYTPVAKARIAASAGSENARQLYEKAIEEAVKRRPHRSHTYWGAANIAEEAGMLERAIDLLLKGSELPPSNLPNVAHVFAAQFISRAAELAQRLGMTERWEELSERARALRESGRPLY